MLILWNPRRMGQNTFGLLGVLGQKSSSKQETMHFFCLFVVCLEQKEEELCSLPAPPAEVKFYQQKIQGQDVRPLDTLFDKRREDADKIWKRRRMRISF